MSLTASQAANLYHQLPRPIPHQSKGIRGINATISTRHKIKTLHRKLRLHLERTESVELAPIIKKLVWKNAIKASSRNDFEAIAQHYTDTVRNSAGTLAQLGK